MNIVSQSIFPPILKQANDSLERHFYPLYEDEGILQQMEIVKGKHYRFTIISNYSFLFILDEISKENIAKIRRLFKTDKYILSTAFWLDGNETLCFVSTLYFIVLQLTSHDFDSCIGEIFREAEINFYSLYNINEIEQNLINRKILPKEKKRYLPRALVCANNGLFYLFKKIGFVSCYRYVELYSPFINMKLLSSIIEKSFISKNIYEVLKFIIPISISFYAFNKSRNSTFNINFDNTTEKIGLITPRSSNKIGIVFSKITGNIFVVKSILEDPSCEKFPVILNPISFPSILPVEYFKKESNKKIIITKYCPNDDVESKINILTATQKSKIIFGVLMAVAMLQENEIIHMDIKASNIFLDMDMNPLLSDFDGCFKATRHVSDYELKHKAHHTISNGRAKDIMYDSDNVGHVLLRVLGFNITFANIIWNKTQCEDTQQQKDLEEAIDKVQKENPKMFKLAMALLRPNKNQEPLPPIVAAEMMIKDNIVFEGTNMHDFMKYVLKLGSFCPTAMSRESSSILSNVLQSTPGKVARLYEAKFLDTKDNIETKSRAFQLYLMSEKPEGYALAGERIDCGILVGVSEELMDRSNDKFRPASPEKIGIGFMMDRVTAIRLYAKAAQQGDPDGMFWLATALLCTQTEHNILKPNDEKCIQLFDKAVELNSSNRNVGFAGQAHLTMVPTHRNIKKAMSYLERVASFGNVEHGSIWAEYALLGVGDYTPESIENILKIMCDALIERDTEFKKEQSFSLSGQLAKLYIYSGFNLESVSIFELLKKVLPESSSYLTIGSSAELFFFAGLFEGRDMNPFIEFFCGVASNIPDEFTTGTALAGYLCLLRGERERAEDCARLSSKLGSTLGARLGEVIKEGADWKAERLLFSGNLNSIKEFGERSDPAARLWIAFYNAFQNKPRQDVFNSLIEINTGESLFFASMIQLNNFANSNRFLDGMKLMLDAYKLGYLTAGTISSDTLEVSPTPEVAKEIFDVHLEPFSDKYFYSISRTNYSRLLEVGEKGARTAYEVAIGLVRNRHVPGGRAEIDRLQELLGRPLYYNEDGSIHKSWVSGKDCAANQTVAIPLLAPDIISQSIGVVQQDPPLYESENL